MSLNILDDDLLGEAEAAAAMGKRCKRTLMRWRALGEGPPYVRIGRTVYYRRQAIHDWLLRQERAAV